MNNDLASSWKNLQSAIGEKINKRESWTKEKKEFIKKTLNDIMNEYEINGEVHVLEEITNLEQVVFQLPNDENYSIKNDNEKEVVSYFDGVLSFSQKLNGDIEINCSYPFIENLMEEQDAVSISLIDPRSITKNLIEDWFVKFLNLMVEWEKDSN